MKVNAKTARRLRAQLASTWLLLCLTTFAVAEEQPSARTRNAQAANHPVRGPVVQGPAVQGPLVQGKDTPATARWRLPEDETPVAHWANADPASIALKTGLSDAPATSRAATPSSPLAPGFSVPWDDSPAWMHSAPTLVQAAKSFRRQGLPILHLWQSTHYQLALGFSPHGRAGLYFTQRIPE